MFRVIGGFAAGRFLLSVTLAGVVQGQQPASSASTLKNPVASTPKSIEGGRKLFQQYCKACHGEDAKGNGPLAAKDLHPADLTDDVWLYGSSDGEIFSNIRNGIGPKFDMKSWKSRMTETEIWSVVNYLRSIGGKNGQD
jgi:cbb3-type cytochrome c oxidase subunit III